MIWTEEQAIDCEQRQIELPGHRLADNQRIVSTQRIHIHGIDAATLLAKSPLLHLVGKPATSKQSLMATGR
jgi:hypothetical protein